MEPTRYVTASDGVRLAVYEQGPSDAPVVVLVHGFPDTAAMWDGVTARLVDGGLRVVRYDVRGAGRSGRPRRTRSYRLRQLSADLEAVLDATAGERRAHLVGHDWGSIQSWESAARPSVARRLASFTALAGPSLDVVASSMTRRAPREIALQAAKSWYIAVFHLGPLIAPLLRLVARRGARIVRVSDGIAPPPGHPAATLADDLVDGTRLYRANMIERAVRPRYTRVAVPTLQVLVTGRDRFIAPHLYDGAEQLADDVRVERIDAGHWVPLTEPERVAAPLLALVSELES